VLADQIKQDDSNSVSKMQTLESLPKIDISSEVSMTEFEVIEYAKNLGAKIYPNLGRKQIDVILDSKYEKLEKMLTFHGYKSGYDSPLTYTKIRS